MTEDQKIFLVEAEAPTRVDLQGIENGTLAIIDVETWRWVEEDGSLGEPVERGILDEGDGPDDAYHAIA